MRILQLGVGSVGEVTARTVAGEPEVSNVVGTADLDEEFALDAEFKKKGLSALVCFGIDPQPFLKLMTQHEMPWHVIDLPPAD
jgi:saccharopine dehydrogenase-like NADP-dependent oxidoreductase